MQFGFVIPAFGAFVEPQALAEVVALGEELGYSDVWFGDHVVVPDYAAGIVDPGWLDPLATCCFVLAGTTRIRAGIEVLVAGYRHPALVAKIVATADRLSGGRILPAVGVGYLRGEFDILGADYHHRGAVTDEHLEVLRLLWDSTGPVTYDGEHVHFDGAVFGPCPVQQPMPLWVGGNAPAAIRRAARLGTGWHPLYPTPEQYAAAHSQIEQQRRAHSFTYSYTCGITSVLDATPEVIVSETWADRDGVPADFGYAPPLPAAPTGRLRFVGTPDDIAGDIDAYGAAGVEHITLRFSSGGPDADLGAFADQLRRFSTEIAPRFTS